MPSILWGQLLQASLTYSGLYVSSDSQEPRAIHASMGLGTGQVLTKYLLNE